MYVAVFNNALIEYRWDKYNTNISFSAVHVNDWTYHSGKMINASVGGILIIEQYGFSWALGTSVAYNGDVTGLRNWGGQYANITGGALAVGWYLIHYGDTSSIFMSKLKVSAPIYSQDNYIGQVTSTNPSQYPTNGRHSDGYWYILQ